MEELHKRVIKRSGEEVDFDLHKIVNAINAANEETDKLHQMNPYQIKAVAENVADKIAGMTHADPCRGYPGYRRDQHYGDAWIRGSTEVCALPL